MNTDNNDKVNVFHIRILSTVKTRKCTFMVLNCWEKDAKFRMKGAVKLPKPELYRRESRKKEIIRG